MRGRFRKRKELQGPRGCRVKGALLGPLVQQQWGAQTLGPRWRARVAYREHLRLRLRGVPRRGAPSRGREARHLASTWAGEKFAETRRERVAALDAGGRDGFEARGGSSGLTAPSRSAAGRAGPHPLGCCVPAGECDSPARGTPSVTLDPYPIVQPHRAFSTATFQLRCLPFKLWETERS